MKEIYKGITDRLLGDSDLKNMVGYTPQLMNIRRSAVPIESGWEKLVIFYLQNQIAKTDFSPQIREVPLIVRVYDRKDDLVVDTISERLILLLEGANLSVPNKVHCYDCSYQGELIPTSYNSDLKSYEKVLRFILTVRQIAVEGSSGLPPKQKGGREWY